MNDKDRELLAQILHAGGAAAQKGFDELVRWCYADALANVLCYVAVAAITMFAFTRLLAWKPEGGFDSHVPKAFRGLGLVVCVTVLVIATASWLPGNLRELVEPRGEAVSFVLQHH